MQRPLRCLLVLMLALTALSIVPATTALAATGEQYLLQATDPHGSIWLPGTTDGTTTGPLDNGTNANSASYGHLWTTDVPSGFCRIIATGGAPGGFKGDGTPNNDANGNPAPSFLDRNTPGGCIIAGGKAGGPDVEHNADGTIKRNADGTIFVYTPDWAVFSNGVYRLTYDPGTQTMTKAELLAPNRYPFNNKPFDAQLGPGDHKLYVANDKDGNIARFSGVSGPISQQTVETSVAKTTDGGRSRAITFACWSNLTTLNGGRGATRVGPGCSPADPAPDLVIAQKNLMTVVLNAETCQTAPGGCTTLLTNIKVLTPMGLRTDPKNPSIIYVSDSPGADSQIIRYTIGTDIQDSYANFGVLDDGTVARFSFAFDVAFDPQHAMYVGDDPSAGATAFNGHYYRVAPNAPADALGQPGVPASPPAPPSVNTGNLFGGGVTLAQDGVWMGTHFWIADGANGLCRMDPTLDAAGNPIPGGMTENPATCMLGANAAGLTKPWQSSFDAGKNLLYVADGSTASVGVVRFTFDPVTETLGNPQVIAAGLSGTGLGLDGQKAAGAAIDTTTDTLYVGFLARGTKTNGQVARVKNASAPDTTVQTVDSIANTTRTAPVFGLGVVRNPDGTKDLYVGDNKGVDVLTNVDACDPGACTSVLLLNVRGPHGFATDGTDHLYMAGPPAPGTGNNTTVVQQYTISTGELFDYSSVGVNPDGTQQQYAFVNSLALNPNNGDLYISDNPDAVAPPNGVGHVWKVTPPGAGAGPSQPTLTVKPGNPTNITQPSFAFSTLTAGATFSCSLVTTGTPDAFAPCTSPFVPATPLADGNYTFKVAAVSGGASSAPAAYSFTVDTVLPVVTITQAPTSPSKVNTPSFTFTSSKPSTTFECSFTTGADAFSPCGSPQSYAAQPDGAYTFKVRGTDLAKNVSAVASSALTIDTVAPTVAASPVGGPYASAQSVTLTANEPATIYYTIDGSVPTTTSTVYAGPISVASTTTLKYIAVDTAGNTGAVASQTYTIGSVSLDSKPVSPSANAKPSFTFSAPGVAAPSYQCALTAIGGTDAFTACTSPQTYGITPDATYTFTVKGTDTGNANASIGSATTQVTIDAAAPRLDSNPPNPSSRATEAFAFSKPEATGWTFQCSFVAQGAADAFTACTSPQNYPAPADGLYTFKVKALDAASTATAVQIYDFQVASGLPTTTVPVASLALSTVSPGLSTTAVPVTLTWSGSSSAAAYEVQQSINGGQFIDVPSCSATTPCTGTTVSVNLKPSATNQSTVTSYRYQVRAKNAAGAWGLYTTQPTSFSVPAADNTSGFSFNGGAKGVNLSGAYNGSVQEMSTTGAFATNSNPLGGTTVAWVSTMGPDRGMASVSVDGGPAQTVDLYSPTLKTAQIVWKADLGGANGHTIKVTVLAQKNAASSGTNVDIDAYISLK